MPQSQPSTPISTSSRLPGRIKSDEYNRLRALIRGTTDQTEFADCELVIEAVFEDLAVKQQVFTRVEQVVGPDTILATNTSSLSVEEIGAPLAHPHRLVGIHFFNPVAVMPLVEIVGTASTSETTVATAFALAEGIGQDRGTHRGLPRLCGQPTARRRDGRGSPRRRRRHPAAHGGTGFHPAQSADDPVPTHRSRRLEGRRARPGHHGRRVPGPLLHIARTCTAWPTLPKCLNAIRPDGSPGGQQRPGTVSPSAAHR